MMSRQISKRCQNDAESGLFGHLKVDTRASHDVM